MMCATLRLSLLMLQGYMITFYIENQQTVQILPANCFKVSAIITAFLQFNYQAPYSVCG